MKIRFSAVLTIAVVLTLLAPYVAALPPAPAPRTESLAGWFTIVWGDGEPAAGGAPVTTYWLTDDRGERQRLFLGERLLAAKFANILALNGKRVVIGATADPSAAQGVGGPALSVQSISPESGAGLDEVAAQAVSGPQPWVTIMCKFPDVAGEPRSLAYFQNQLGSSYPGLDHYWREVSYNIANISGSRAVGWFTLPHERSYYVYGSPAQLDFNRAANDCTAAADGQIYFPSFVGINMMFNGDLDGYSWGGNHYFNRDGVSRSWRVTWLPPWGYANQAVIAHEMGHGFGMPHSSGSYGQTYDNVWDVMSDIWSICRGDPTYGCVAQHASAPYKAMLGWFGNAPVYTAAANGSVLINIEQSALPQLNNYRMAKIPINGSSTDYYTVESRRRVGYDSILPGDAVIIHHYNQGWGNPAHVIDIDGNGKTGDEGAMWRVGETFSDPANRISVTVHSARPSGFLVTIVTGNGTSQPPPPPPPPAGGYDVRANVGGGAYTDSAGFAWSGDKPFSAGAWGYSGGYTYGVADEILNTIDDPLYRNERYGDFSYRFTVPNGTYNVIMHFSENYFIAAGRRFFDVRLENQTVLSDFDVFAAAGGAFKAVKRSVLINVSDGVLDLTFVRKLDNPMISAVRVVKQ